MTVAVRLLFRADAAFAKPEIYEYLETRQIGYAIRLPANEVLQRKIAHLQTRPTEWPSPKSIVSYHDFTYRAQSWNVSRRVVAKAEWHQGELFPRVGFIVANLSYPTIGIVCFYNGRGTAEQWIKEGKYALNWTRLSCHKFVANQVRLELFVLAYPSAEGGNFMRRLALPEAMKHWVADQSSDQDDQDRRTVGAPCQKAGVSTCRGAGNQGNAGRDTGTNWPASAGSWLVRFRSVGIGDGYGVVEGKRASQGGDLGVDQRFGDFRLGRTVVALRKRGI